MARGTVRKLLRSDETSFSYGRERQAKPKIGLKQDRRDGFFNGECGKAARDQPTPIPLYDEL
ncbi:Uncharacterized protein MLTONO_6006 [Mesorhizobium loti]|nr:Uncharacterized protein MLTONO_6006 [Mesorhizobium loti]